MAPALVACLREASEQIGWRVKPLELTARIRGSRRGIAGEVGTDGDVSPWRVAPIGVAEIRNSAVGGKCGRRDAPARHGRVAYETRASRPQRASPTVAARNFPARPSLPLSAIPRVISDDVRSRR